VIVFIQLLFTASEVSSSVLICFFFFACVINLVNFFSQVQDKFRLDLNDEEAVQYLQSLIDESVSAMLPVVVEQFHKMAQVSQCYIHFASVNKVNELHFC